MCLLKLFLTSFCILLVNAARILTVVPTPSISHQVVFRPLTQELAKRGHEVVVITADPAFPKGQTPDNLTEIDLHDFSYEAWVKAVHSDKTSGSSADTYDQVKIILEMLTKIFEMQMKTEEVINVTNNSSNKYDLLIIESCVIPALGLTHKFKVPVITMSSLGGFFDHYDVMGAPSRPVLLYPTVVQQKLVNLTLWDKIKELYNHYKLTNLVHSFYKVNNDAVRRIFGPDTPTIEELYKNIDMFFLNIHPMWEFNRPITQNVVYMGGLHQKKNKELPRDLKTYLDSSKHGVIYISFGTNVSPSLLPAERIQTLVKAFSKLPYDILWKWDKDELPNRSPNIRISKWLPQSDLLKHPKLKLFITQGGLQSTDEAIAAGVPLLGMPMLGDQWYNVEMYLHYKIGVRLDLEHVTEENFKNAINSVVKDDSYRKNIERLRSIMKDQPQSPLERAVWWTEYLLRHGGAAHLKSRTANMSWSEYLDVELLTAIGFCILFVLAVIGFLINFVYSFVIHGMVSTNKLKKS